MHARRRKSMFMTAQVFDAKCLKKPAASRHDTLSYARLHRASMFVRYYTEIAGIIRACTEGTGDIYHNTPRSREWLLGDIRYPGRRSWQLRDWSSVMAVTRLRVNRHGMINELDCLKSIEERYSESTSPGL